jgi:hypothetical protein
MPAKAGTHILGIAHHCVPWTVRVPRAEPDPSAHWIVRPPRGRAIASLIIATRGASGRSPIEKKRPRSNGVPRVLKKSALTSSLVNRRRSESVPWSRSTMRTSSLARRLARHCAPARQVSASMGLRTRGNPRLRADGHGGEVSGAAGCCQSRRAPGTRAHRLATETARVVGSASAFPPVLVRTG